jgi:tetratricopeptide (TPR) repeat protein
MGVSVPRPASAQSRPNSAAELAARAKATFDRGEFQEATVLLQQAYALEPTSALLYNLGRAYQQGGDKAKAIEAYERYLAQAGHPADEGAVSATIAQLRGEIRHDEEVRSEAERLAAREAAAQAEANRRAALRVESPPPQVQTPARRAGPWIVAGLGAAGVATGAVLGGLALAQHASAENAPGVASAMSEQGKASSLATGANVAFVAGGVVAAAGVVWGLLDLRASIHQREVTASVGLGTATVRLEF